MYENNYSDKERGLDNETGFRPRVEGCAPLLLIYVESIEPILPRYKKNVCSQHINYGQFDYLASLVSCRSRRPGWKTISHITFYKLALTSIYMNIICNLFCPMAMPPVSRYNLFYA